MLSFVSIFDDAEVSRDLLPQSPSKSLFITHNALTQEAWSEASMILLGLYEY
jgi:hypothetical protein